MNLKVESVPTAASTDAVTLAAMKSAMEMNTAAVAKLIEAALPQKDGAGSVVDVQA